MPIIKMPDGNQVNFPDDMPKEQIKSLILSKFPELGEKKSEEPRAELKPLTEDKKAKSKMNWLDTANNFVDDFKSGFREGAQYGAERLANGATLGMYDKVNTWLGGDARERAKNVEGYDNAVGRGDALLNSKNIGTMLDFVGSMYPAAKIYKGIETGKLGIKPLAKALGLYEGEIKGMRGASALATSGAIEEGLKGLINSDTWDDAQFNGLVNAIGGGVVAGGLGIAGKLAKFAWKASRQPVSQAIQYLKDELGDSALNELVKKAKDEGRSLVEVANNKVVNFLKNAQKATSEANDTVKANLPSIEENAIDKTADFVENFFGKTNGFENKEVIKEMIDTETKPLWDVVYSHGDVSKINPQLAKMLREDKALKAVIKDVKSDVNLPSELQKAADGDMRLLERYRQNIEEKTSEAFFSNRAKYKKDDLKALQDRFLGEVKKSVKGYDEVLDKYSEFHKIDEATENAAKIFKNSNPKKFAKEYEALSSAEKDAYKLGIKDEVEKMLGDVSNNNAWRKFFSPNNQQKLKTVYGEKEGEKFIKYAKEEYSRLNTFKELDKVQSRKLPDWIPYIFTKPINQLGDIANKTILKAENAKNMGLAELLSSPTTEAVEKALKNYSNNKVLKANKFLQEKLGKDYLPVSALLGTDVIIRNNKL